MIKLLLQAPYMKAALFPRIQQNISKYLDNFPSNSLHRIHTDLLAAVDRNPAAVTERALSSRWKRRNHIRTLTGSVSLEQIHLVSDTEVRFLRNGKIGYPI